MTEVKFDVSYEQIRSLVVESLGTHSQGQITSFHLHIARLFIQRGIVPDPANSGAFNRPSQYELSPKHKSWIEDIIWDLIIEGVVRPGLGDTINNGLPWYHVSEYGKTVLGNNPPQPYDPDSYLARVKAISDIDDIILTYLEESLKAFRIHCLLSSMITLGCASEKAILLLIDACQNSLANPTDKADFTRKTDTISIKRKHDEFQNIFKTKILVLPALPYDIKENLDTYLTGLFSIIRTHRNDAGHPSGKVIQREHLYSYLVVFPTYLEKVYALMDWLSRNTI
jgi:hypothetical protein